MSKPRVVIIGAGFGGIAAAVELLKRGLDDVVLLEKADRVGGVWRDNSYPGCACDVPAPLYSYSFALNPEWSRRFPPHEEILAYVRKVADRFGITPRVRFGTEVTGATWDERAQVWRIAVARAAPAGERAGGARDRAARGGEERRGGEEIEADVLVPAVGQLSRPSMPSLPGVERFAGRVVHTAQWDENIRVDGRRVAVVGTGASAIQLVPAIAGRAAHVTVVQRSAPWTLPKPDRRYGAGRRAAYAKMPQLMRLPRAGTWAMTIVTGLALTGNRAAGAFLRGVSTLQRRWQVRDRTLRARVTPDEPMGCKRVLYTSSWLPALAREDVSLVTEKIIEVVPEGIRTADGVVHGCDLLVYATGFAATEFLAPMRIVGRGGRTLDEEWRDGAYAYLGMAVPGFPNLFLIYGPNTNTGNTSVIYFHESQARYLARLVQRVAEDQNPLEVRRERATGYDDEMQRRLASSVWAGCQSWYRTATGRIVTNWPGMAGEYRRRTSRLDIGDYTPVTVRNETTR